MGARRLSAKKMNRKARLTGRGDLDRVLASQALPADYEANLGAYRESAAGRPSDPKLAIAHDLLEIARKLPTGEAPPKKAGRPSKASLAEVVRPNGLSRQERRYRDRMLQKAQEAWDKVTNGQGVVLVNGKPVPSVKGGDRP